MTKKEQEATLEAAANKLVNDAVNWARSLPIGAQFRESNCGASIQLRCAVNTFFSDGPFIIFIVQSVKIDESIQGKGICRLFFEQIENINSAGVIIHESVGKWFLRSRHKRHGFTSYANNRQFYKIVGCPLDSSHKAFQIFQNEKAYAESRRQTSHRSKKGLGHGMRSSLNL